MPQVDLREAAPPTLDRILRQLLREVVREVVREELAKVQLHPAATMSNEPDSLADYVTVAAAAAMAQVAEKTVRRWVRRGDLKAHHLGRLVRIKRTEMERFMAEVGSADSSPTDTEAVAATLLAKRRR